MATDILAGLISTSDTPVDANQVKADQVAAYLKKGSSDLFQMILAKRQDMYNQFWKTVSPNMISRSLGQVAASLFRRDAQLVAFATSVITEALQSDGKSPTEIAAIIAAVLPGVPAEYTATPAQDGTVTISLK